MILQISSGQGPKECELVVGKLFSSLQAEFPDIEKIYEFPSDDKNCYKSIMFSVHEDLSVLDGSVKWVCASPFRPHHKRKNWFVDVSVIPEIEGNEHGSAQGDSAYGKGTSEKIYGESGGECSRKACYYDDRDIVFESFHSGGNGGQNVNKVETGVRITHVPTGIVVTSTSERSQHMNRMDALKKLNTILSQREKQKQDRQKNQAWIEHTRLERGNPVRVYRGMEFKLDE
ncbi:MAG: peptide chain release factor-like protein [Lachnospiraceae bacterium]|nr:peptide chain release factor-like protein [Lachnospiraceae bacterium]